MIMENKGKAISHILETFILLKTKKSVCVVTRTINRYCDLFKKTTGCELFYEELNPFHYNISLNNFNQPPQNEK